MPSFLQGLTSNNHFVMLERKWFVTCLCTFLVQFTVFGVHQNFGIMFHELLKVFHDSPSAAGKSGITVLLPEIWEGVIWCGLSFLVCIKPTRLHQNFWNVVICTFWRKNLFFEVLILDWPKLDIKFCRTFSINNND